MSSEKKQRVATAVGFLSGVIACLAPLRDLRSWWPPDEVWAVLGPSQRLEFLGGVALIVVTIAVSIASRRTKSY
jgi:hypothetical protein